MPPAALSAAPQAFFLPGGAAFGGQRLVLWHAPVEDPAASPADRGSVLFLHAFGEEMNKSRRMAAMAARALAKAGFGVLQIDLMGCGDSSGDWLSASWQAWVDDACQAAAWLQQRQPGPLWLWGERAGCLLAAQAATRLDTPPNFLFWQPQAQGKLALQQFLRLKMASQIQPVAQASADPAGAAKGITERLLSELAQGGAVEVGGYQLGADLAKGLAEASLSQVPAARKGAGPTPRLVWLEVSSRASAVLLPAAAPVLARWQAAGYALSSQVVAGPPFWQTVEIEDAPELVTATVQQLLRRMDAGDGADDRADDRAEDLADGRDADPVGAVPSAQTAAAAQPAGSSATGST